MTSGREATASTLTEATSLSPPARSPLSTPRLVARPHRRTFNDDLLRAAAGALKTGVAVILGRGLVWDEQNGGYGRWRPSAFLGHPVPPLFAAHGDVGDERSQPRVIADGIASDLSSSGYDAVWVMRPDADAYDALREHLEAGRSGLSFEGFATTVAAPTGRWSWTHPRDHDEIDYDRPVGFAIVDQPGHEHARIDAVLTSDASWLLDYDTHRLEADQSPRAGRDALDTAWVYTEARGADPRRYRGATGRSSWRGASVAPRATPTPADVRGLPLEESGPFPLTLRRLGP
ncbi:hypothetical protein [Microbacterium sp.]|uniref:hypothetical protein n=1 Tax=Microbacterium sp. TaxID=51671 RepID=UPI003F6F5D4C